MPNLEHAASAASVVSVAGAVAGHHPDPRMAQLMAFYDELSLESLSSLALVYSDNARFVDPFNDVTGLKPIRQVFEHMFTTLDAPRFRVTHAVCEGDSGFVLWDFDFKRKGHKDTQHIHGATHLLFGPDGRVDLHRDYWDAARQVYEQVPILGTVLRWLRRQLALKR